MRFVAGGFATAAGLRLFAGIGVELDDVAVGIADENRLSERVSNPSRS